MSPVAPGTASKKRQMVFVPEINPDSFVLFFEKGDTGRSWSIRDYSKDGVVNTTRPGDLGWDARLIREKAVYSLDAPTVRTDDLSFWHGLTCSCNSRFLGPRQDPDRTNDATAGRPRAGNGTTGEASTRDPAPASRGGMDPIRCAGAPLRKIRFQSVLTLFGRTVALLIAVAGGAFFTRIFGLLSGLTFGVVFVICIFSPHSGFQGRTRTDRRQPQKHRWLTNGLKPRTMHFGPRRLF